MTEKTYTQHTIVFSFQLLKKLGLRTYVHLHTQKNHHIDHLVPTHLHACWQPHSQILQHQHTDMTIQILCIYTPKDDTFYTLDDTHISIHLHTSKRPQALGIVPDCHFVLCAALRE